jgi:integrase
MRVSTKIVRARYPKKDKTYSVDIRITKNRSSAYVPTGIFIYKNDIDLQTGEVNRNCTLYESVRKVNEYILSKRRAVNSFITELFEMGGIDSMTASDIKKAYMNQSDKAASFTDYTNILISNMKKAKQFGNASVYNQALVFVTKHSSEEVYFTDIDYSFLNKLQNVHIGAGYGYNSLSVVLRTIRAIFNKAIKEDIIDEDLYPFKKFKIKQVKTKKRAITKNDIVKIETYLPEFGSPEFHAHNYFMFSFYMIGMNFSDIAHLKFSNIKNNRLEYIRKKTGRFYSLELIDKAKAIIDLYQKYKFIARPGPQNEDTYIFPIIKRKEPELIMYDIQNGLKMMNKYIRRIADKLGIESHITSYVARHSWASIGKTLNIPLAVISDGLGHEDLSTTQIYLDSMDKSTIDQASQLITG